MCSVKPLSASPGFWMRELTTRRSRPLSPASSSRRRSKSWSLRSVSTLMESIENQTITAPPSRRGNALVESPPRPARPGARRLRLGAAAAHGRSSRRSAAAGRAQGATPHAGEWRHAARRLLLAAQQGDAGGGVVPARRGGLRRRADEADRGAAEEALRGDALPYPG